MIDQPSATRNAPFIARSWQGELVALLRLAWPLILSQLAQSALYTTDVMMIGWLGPRDLATVSVTVAVLYTLLLPGFGVVGAVAPMVAQARGARDVRSIRRTVRQGLWVAIALSIVLTPILWQMRPILLLLGQEPEVADLAQGFIHTAVWLLLPALALNVLRSFLAAQGATVAILLITLGGVALNFLTDWALIFGHFGMPRLELAGAGLSNTIVNVAMAIASFAYVLTHRRYRRYHILARFWRPDWSRFREILRIGGPIGLMLMAEVGLFSAASVLMGWLGTDELAANAVALQCANLTFMVPLGLGQAATVRVGLAYGGGSPSGVARAGWTAIVLALVFMSCTSLLYLVAPGPIVGLFLDRTAPANQAALALAASYLSVVAFYQLADGLQVTAASTLRGLTDTRVPMWMALAGYWLFGLPMAYLCGFVLGLRGVGIWIGLGAGLTIVALLLTGRFAVRQRLRPVRAGAEGSAPTPAPP